MSIVTGDVPYNEDGEIHGVVKTYNGQGELSYVATWANDKLNGRAISYWARNKGIEYDKYYINDLEEGETIRDVEF